MVKLERAATACPLPFAIWFGSIDLFVDLYVVPEIEAGNLEALDMIGIVAGAAPLGSGWHLGPCPRLMTEPTAGNEGRILKVRRLRGREPTFFQ